MQFERTKELAFRLCERCVQVCDRDCRRMALRQSALLHQLWLGVRV